MIVIASLLAILEKGALTAYRSLNVPATIAEILTGFILLCMLGCEFFVNYRLSVHHRKEG